MHNILTLNQPIQIRQLSFRISLKILLILSFSLLIGLLAFYIFQVNSVIKHSYLIKNYDNKLSNLLQENNNLEINFSELNSLSNIETLVLNSNFEKVNEVKYIQLISSEVAFK